MRALGEHEHIVGAWAEAPSGPGWSNRLIWVCIRDGLDGRHRVDAFQPEEHPIAVTVAFRMLLAASEFMASEAIGMAARERKPRPSASTRGRGE